MTKKPRVYKPRLVGTKVMMPADLKRLHKYMHTSALSLTRCGRLLKSCGPSWYKAPAKRAALSQGRETCEECVWASLPYLHFYSPAARKTPPMR